MDDDDDEPRPYRACGFLPLPLSSSGGRVGIIRTEVVALFLFVLLLVVGDEEGEGEENFQTFYYAFENLSDGLHDVTVEIISPDNQNTFLSEPLVFTLDTTVPELSVESIDLTNSDRPAVEGSVDDANATVI